MAEISAICKLTWKANFVENTGMYGNTLKWLLLWSFVISQTSMLPKSYATCMSPIMHLFCPPPPKFCITFVFHFFWILQLPQEKLKTMLVQNFGGQIRCIMGDVQGHIKRNTKLNLMLLASNLYISHLGCMPNDQLIFNILWHLWMASLKLYLQFKFTK